MAEQPAKRRYLGRQAKAKSRTSTAASSSAPCGTPRVEFQFGGCLTARRNFQKWSRGQIQATELQEACNLAYCDQVRLLESLSIDTAQANSVLKSFAQLGSWGSHPGNVAKELRKLVGTPDGCPEPMIIPARCFIHKPQAGAPKIQQVDVPYMPPHLVLHHLFATNRPRFNELFLGGCNDGRQLEACWRQVTSARDPRLANHPMLTTPNWAQKAIPIAIHADAVPAVGVGKSHQRAFDCFSWTPLLAKGPTMTIKQYLTGLFEDCKAQPSPTSEADTMQEIWRHVLWSFLSAYTGKFPEKDAWNKPWGRYTFEYHTSNDVLADGFSWLSGASKATSKPSARLGICAITALICFANTAPQQLIAQQTLACYAQTSVRVHHGRG